MFYIVKKKKAKKKTCKCVPLFPTKLDPMKILVDKKAKKAKNTFVLYFADDYYCF